MKTKSGRSNLFPLLGASLVLAAAFAQPARGGDEYASQAAQPQDNVLAQSGPASAPRAVTVAHRSQSAKSARFDTNDPAYQQFLREVLERSGI
jgi:hypothetical protein